MESRICPQILPPAWIRWFINDAVDGIVDRQSAAPIGCHYFHDRTLNVWEISLFLARTEVFGGASDGRRVPSGLQIDVDAVSSAFDAAPKIYWQSEKFSSDDELGNHLSFEGSARGYHVWLRILESPPDWAGTGRFVYAESGQVKDLW